MLKLGRVPKTQTFEIFIKKAMTNKQLLLQLCSNQFPEENKQNQAAANSIALPNKDTALK